MLVAHTFSLVYMAEEHPCVGCVNGSQGIDGEGTLQCWKC